MYLCLLDFSLTFMSFIYLIPCLLWFFFHIATFFLFFIRSYVIRCYFCSLFRLLLFSTIMTLLFDIQNLRDKTRFKIIEI